VLSDQLSGGSSRIAEFEKRRERLVIALNVILPVRNVQKDPFLQMRGPHTLVQGARRRGSWSPGHASDCQAL
jgi:hypothetical protein